MAGSVRDLNNGGGNLRLPLRVWPPPPTPLPPVPPTQPAAAAPLCWALQREGERKTESENERQNKANNKLMQLYIKDLASKCNYFEVALRIPSTDFSYYLH